MVWEAFSIIYYGFPFPNTAYAKLYLPFSSFSQIFNQGIAYYLNSLLLDPISLIMIALAITSVFLLPMGSSNIPLVCGLLLYLAYTLKIGGDFMSGRFLAAPVFLSVLIFFSTFRPEKKHGIILFFFIFTLSTITPFNPWHTDTNYSGVVSNHFITDERQFYYQSTGLLRTKPGQTLNGSEDHQTTRRRSAAEFSKKTRRTTVHIAMGVLGFYAGPNVYIVDEVALCDPLLARIPSWCKEFCPGHMIRKIPNGYLRSINTDSNQLTNPHLHQLYDALRLATRAPLFSFQRFQAIAKLNLGAYDFSQHLSFFYAPRPHKPLPFDLANDHYSELIRQARTYIDDCDYLHLEECLLNAQKLDPKRPEARIYLGILYEYLGELDQAAEQFKYFVDRQEATWNKFYPELLRDIAKEAQP
jgi:arabinofuranosyltransferase